MPEPLFDPAPLRRLREASGDDPAFVVEFIDLVLRDTPGRLEALERGAGASDARAVAAAAHTLRTRFGMVGAPTLADRCAHLEEDAAAGRLTGAVAEAEALREGFGEVRLALAAEREAALERRR